MGPRLLVVVAALAVYATTYSAPFHFDDYSLFTDPAVIDGQGLWELLDPARTRPLTYFTFWANYQLSGAQPAGYHLFNLLLFAATVWLVGSVFERVVERRAAWAATAIFALHPLASEPVAYVFGRASILATGLAATSWRLWVDDRRGWSVAVFGLALLAKEEAAALPAFLLGYEAFILRANRDRLRRAAPALAAMAGLVVLAAGRLLYAAQVTPGAGAAVDLGAVTPWTYLLTQGKVIWLYLRLLAAPFGQSFDHPIELSAGADPLAILGWAALAALVALSLWQARRRREWYWLAGGLILLAPTSSFVPLADLAAERRMLLPLMSFALAGGALVAALPRRAVAPLTIAVALLLGGLTWSRCQVWRSEEALWRDTVGKAPGKARPRLHLARALAAGGPETLAERTALLEQARALAPNDPDVLGEIGVFYLENRDPTAALQAFEAARSASAQEGSETQAQINAYRGSALFLLGRTAEAEQAFREAVVLDPCNFDARNNLILLLRSQRRQEPELRRPPPDCRWSPEQRRAFE